VKTLYIEPGNLEENGYIESFNDKLRGKLLNREIFTTLTCSPKIGPKVRRFFRNAKIPWKGVLAS